MRPLVVRTLLRPLPVQAGQLHTGPATSRPRRPSSRPPSSRRSAAADLLLDLNGPESARALERRSVTTPGRRCSSSRRSDISPATRAADLLFQLVSRRYERRSRLITTNPPVKHWDTVFPNASCDVALIDRLTHHVEILLIEGQSFRRREAELTHQQPSPPVPAAHIHHRRAARARRNQSSPVQKTSLPRDRQQAARTRPPAPRQPSPAQGTTPPPAVRQVGFGRSEFAPVPAPSSDDGHPSLAPRPVPRSLAHMGTGAEPAPRVYVASISRSSTSSAVTK